MAKETKGAFIGTGAADWQVLQRAADGTGEIRLQGRWKHEEPGTVQARLVHQDTGAAVTAALDWHSVPTQPDGTWSAHLTAIPAGGLYRLETRYLARNVVDAEWATRGDMRHHLGVGDLWVIAGQSNSAGFGRGPYNDPSELGVHLFRNSETWALATHPMNESTDSRHTVNLEDANPGHSPYLHFGRILRRTLNIPIGLVQTALGGSAFARWNPTEDGSADLYENMIHCIEAVGGCVAGILWYQGESETDKTVEHATRYADRFVAAVQAWRERLAAPSLPVLTVQLNRFYTPPNPDSERCWSIVRDAQRRVPGRLPGVWVVPSSDLPLSDLIHTSPAGNLVLGERLARVALNTVCHRADNFVAPDIQSARRSADGHSIELTFAPVTSRLNNIDAQACPFRVEDADGLVPVTQVNYPRNATLVLALGRALNGAALVHGGYGLNPAPMPMDIERLLPVLSFYAQPVE